MRNKEKKTTKKSRRILKRKRKNKIKRNKINKKKLF